MYEVEIGPKNMAYGTADDQLEIHIRIADQDQTIWPGTTIQCHPGQGRIHLQPDEVRHRHEPMNFSTSDNTVLLAALSVSDSAVYVELMSEKWQRHVRAGHAKAMGWLLLRANAVGVVCSPFGRSDRGDPTTLHITSSSPLDVGDTADFEERIGPTTRAIIEQTVSNVHITSPTAYFRGTRPTDNISIDLHSLTDS